MAFFKDPSIDQPAGITTGPDGALWYTNEGNNLIGRITTSGVVTNYTGTGVSTPSGITSGPDGAPGSPTRGTPGSDGSLPREPSLRTPVRPSTNPPRPPPAPTAPCGSPIRAIAPLGGSPPGSRDQLFVGRITTPTPSLPALTALCGSPIRRNVTEAPSGASRPPGRSQHDVGPQNYCATGITTSPDGAIWFVEPRLGDWTRTTSGAETFYANTGVPNGTLTAITGGPTGLFGTRLTAPTGIQLRRPRFSGHHRT